MRTAEKPAYQRWLARFHWVRSRGAKATVGSMLASNIGKFREFVLSQGCDPEALGDFARKVSQAKRNHPRQERIER